MSIETQHWPAVWDPERHGREIDRCFNQPTVSSAMWTQEWSPRTTGVLQAWVRKEFSDSTSTWDRWHRPVAASVPKTNTKISKILQFQGAFFHGEGWSGTVWHIPNILNLDIYCQCAKALISTFEVHFTIYYCILLGLDENYVPINS